MKLNQKGFGVIEGLLAIIAIAMIVGVGFYVINTNKDKTEDSPSNSVQQTLSKPDEQKQNEPKIPDLVDYSPDSIRIIQKSDVQKLKDSSQSFKDYIASIVGEKPEYPAEGCDQPNTITVQKIVKDEFAVGGIGSCAGGRAVWKKTDGKWNSVTALGGQVWPPCKDVVEQKVPPQIIEKCYDENNPKADEFGIISNPN